MGKKEYLQTTGKKLKRHKDSVLEFLKFKFKTFLPQR